MAHLEAAVYARLAGFAGLAALAGTRIYPGARPQGALLPAVVYQRISTVRFSAMGVDSGVVKARVQLDAWALTFTAALDVKEQVRAALQRWRDAAAAVPILETFLDGEWNNKDETAEPVATGQPGEFRAGLDVMIAYREA